MLLYNTTSEKQSVQAFGNWFSFAPGQMKVVDDKFGDFIAKDKKQYGIVALPQEFAEDITYKESEVGKQILLEKLLEGRGNRINFIRGIMHNEEVSLRQDLEKANLKINPNVFSSELYVKMLEEYKGYKKSDDDAQRERMDRIQRLKSDINKE